MDFRWLNLQLKQNGRPLAMQRCVDFKFLNTNMEQENFHYQHKSRLLNY
jgi:hypothetical protein